MDLEKYAFCQINGYIDYISYNYSDTFNEQCLQHFYKYSDGIKTLDVNCEIMHFGIFITNNNIDYTNSEIGDYTIAAADDIPDTATESISYKLTLYYRER